MKKIDKHEPYCGCINCKPIDTTDIPETGEWPALKLEPDTRPTPQGEGGCA